MDIPVENSKSQSFRFGRLIRFLGSLLVLFLFWIWICGAARMLGGKGNGAVLVALSVYVFYLIIQGGLLMWLTGLLFKQHQMQAKKFSLSGMLLITTMIALPFGFCSIIEGIVEQADFQNDPDAPQPNFRSVVATLYLSVIPLLTICEALMIWLTRFRRTSIEAPRNPKLEV